MLSLIKVYISENSKIIIPIYTYQTKGLNISFRPDDQQKKGCIILGGFKLAVKKHDVEIFEVFFRRKPAMILVALRKNQKNRYGSVLAKEVDCTYSHAVKILQEMEKAKLVSFEKHGRIKTISLTDQGNKVAEYIEKIEEALK